MAETTCVAPQVHDDEPLLSDEKLRKLLKPTPTEEDAANVVRASFCVNPTEDDIKIICQLDSYDDCNFKVSINQKPFLLKFHNGVESADFLRSWKESSGDYYKAGCASSVIHLQTAMLWILQSHGIPTSAPVHPISSHDDDRTATASPVSIHIIPVADHSRSPTQLVVRLYEWIPGRPLSSIPVLPLETLADVGRMLGRVHTALDPLSLNSKNSNLESDLLERQLMPTVEDRQRWMHLKDPSLLVPARRFHQWDGKHTKELRGYLSYIPIAKRRGMIDSIITAFDETLVQTGLVDQFRRGINHGDFNDANILMEEEKISGVIDFGDSVESWRILDVSTAMAYAMLSTYGKSNRSVSAAAALLRGYNAVYPITDLERIHLVLLIACRLACSCTLGAFSYHQNPTNKYLLLHSEPAWRALELIWGYDAKRRHDVTTAINFVFQEACLNMEATGDIIECSDLAMPDPSIPDLLQTIRLPTICNKPKKGQSTHLSQFPSKPTITFVTGNSKKLEEVKRMLGMESAESTMPFVLTHKSLDLPELQGETLNVARAKCYTAAEQLKGAVIVEDTSLCFNAFNGMPGVFIKWFLDSCGLEGLNRMLMDYEDKSAYAQTIVAFSAGPGHEPVLFEGRTMGKIVMPRGELAFGWDPIFEPDEGQGLTYAEMSKAAKDAISHRSRAFASIRQYLEQNIELVASKLKNLEK